MNIRQMEIGDLDQVMEIETESFSVPWTLNGFFTFLIRDDTLFLVAVENERIEGYAGIVMAPPEGDITNVAVRSSARGKGTGKALVRNMIEEVRKLGVSDIFLEVRKSNKIAIDLYKSHGFTEISVRKDYYEEPKEDAVIMKRAGS